MAGNFKNFNSLSYNLRLNLKRRKAGAREGWSLRASKNDIEIYI